MARRKNDSKRQEQFLFSTFTFSSSTQLKLTAVPLIRSVNAVINAVTYPVNNDDDDMVIFAYFKMVTVAQLDESSSPDEKEI